MNKGLGYHIILNPIAATLFIKMFFYAGFFALYIQKRKQLLYLYEFFCQRRYFLFRMNCLSLGYEEKTLKSYLYKKCLEK